jgi:diacylglycerol kinase family enzyme
VPEVMRGTHGKFEPVTLGSCTSMKVTADRPLYIHADGEIYTSFGSNLRSVSFQVLPGALRVVRG